MPYKRIPHSPLDLAHFQRESNEMKPIETYLLARPGTAHSLVCITNTPNKASACVNESDCFACSGLVSSAQAAAALLLVAADSADQLHSHYIRLLDRQDADVAAAMKQQTSAGAQQPEQQQPLPPSASTKVDQQQRRQSSDAASAVRAVAAANTRVRICLG